MTEPFRHEAFGDDPVGGQDREWADLESIVRAAGEYVEPTDDLRPRTLEWARGRCRQQQFARRAGSLAVAALLLSLSFPSRIDHSGRFEMAYQMHRQAAQQAIEEETGSGWGLVEVFTEWRCKQAERFSGWNETSNIH